jgi:FkbM family methyltransferase
MEWMKRRARGTFVHWLVLRWQGTMDRQRTALKNQSNAYDNQTREVMRRVLLPDSNGIDVGAHVGGILHLMVEMAPEGVHYAFEALPHLAAELRQAYPRVIVQEAAITNFSGYSDFQYVENDPAYSGLRRREYDRPDPLLRTIQVATTTLDEAIPSDSRIAFIKMDIEGGEFHALQGAVNTIGRNRPVVVFEASAKSTGWYGVTATDVYSLVVDTLQYELSTMARWLAQRPAYTRDEYRDNWDHGSDYYFIATPRRSSPGRRPTLMSATLKGSHQPRRGSGRMRLRASSDVRSVFSASRSVARFSLRSPSIRRRQL